MEFLVGASFVLLFFRYGWSWTLLEYSIFAFSLIVCSFIDIDHMILPDVFTLSGIVIGLVGAFLNPERSFFDAGIGFLIGGGFLFFVSYLYFVLRKIEGLGGGDIKLLGWIGAMLGWQSLPFVLFTSSIIGLVIGLIYLFITKKDLQSGIPFGPFLSLAAFLYAIVDTQPLLQWLFPFSSGGL